MNLVVEENNELDTFLRKGEISQAAQVAMSVLKGLNEKSTCEQELSLDVKQLVSDLSIRAKHQLEIGVKVGTSID